MKKFIFTCAALFTLQIAVMCQPNFGIAAGLTLANMYAKSGGEKDHGKAKAGFTVGIVANVPIAEHIAFMPSLNFTQKGTRDESTQSGTDVTSKINLNYIELPLNVVYQTTMSSGSFFAGAGPSLSYGISGKASVKASGQELSDKVHFGNSDEDDFKAFDFGINILAGYQSNQNIFIALNYNAGLSNILPGSPSDVTLKNGYFGIRIGYLLSNMGNK